MMPISPNTRKVTIGVFISFSGNCKKALKFYQSCFGGDLHLETFEQEVPGYTERPVISGSLISDDIVIHGSDLVHNEGRKIGNYLSIYLACKSTEDRRVIFKHLSSNHSIKPIGLDEEVELIEVVDAFEVRWLLGVG